VQNACTTSAPDPTAEMKRYGRTRSAGEERREFDGRRGEENQQHDHEPDAADRRRPVRPG
jgi:hypothetical protein